MISVIIPSHNMASFLPDAVGSIARNSFNDVEIVIVNDGSTDDTQEVVEELFNSFTSIPSTQKKYIQISHKGKAAAVNRALRDCRGEYISILDADDKLPADSLQLRYDKAVKSGVELVLGGFSTFDESRVFSYRPPPKSNSSTVLINELLFNAISPFHQNSMLISRDLVKRAGYMDERLIRAQDKDYALRLIREARGIEIVDRPVYQYRRYDRGYENRFRNRMRTIRYKSLVITKHTHGIKKWVALAWGTLIEIGKAAYELFSIYRK